MASTSERARIDQIVGEFFAKSLHIILDGRVPHFASQDRAEAAVSSSSAVTRGPDRWFNLETDKSEVVPEHVELWRRSTLEPMVVDILLQQPAGSELSLQSPRSSGGSSHPVPLPGSGGVSREEAGGAAELVEEGAAQGTSLTLLERWVVQYERRRKHAAGSRAGVSMGSEGGPGGGFSGGQDGGGCGGAGTGGAPYSASHPIEVPVVYKHTVIMLRSLYCMMRSLPAHRLFRLAKAASSHRSFTLAYRISPTPPPLSAADAAAMSTWRFTPVDTPSGRMCLSVAYRHTTAVTALEVTPTMLPRIIADYVGSPSTDPLRRFPNPQVGHSIPSSGPAGRGVHIVPLVAPAPITAPSSAPALGRRPSFGASQYPPPAIYVAPGTSPSHASGSPSPISFLHPSHSQATATLPPQPSPSQPIPIHQMYNRSSSSRSPSPSPSPPAPLPELLPRSLPRCSSAPVSIPRALPRNSGGSSSGCPQAPRPVSSRELYPPPPAHLSRSPGQLAHVRGSPPVPSAPTSALGAEVRGEVCVRPGGPSQLARLLGAGQAVGMVPRGEGSGPRLGEAGGALHPMGASPPLPFASTPTTGRASLLTMAPYEGQLAAIARASPPISGRETSALALARLPSFSPSPDFRAMAPLSISALADSALTISPPHPYHNPQQVVSSGRSSGGLPSGGRLSMYRTPQLTYGGGAAPEGGLDEEEFALPFAVDDEELARRNRGESAGGGVPWAGSSPAGRAPAALLEPAGHAGLSSRHSQDAAVGALVRTLRSAAPLRQGHLAAPPASPSPGTSPKPLVQVGKALSDPSVKGKGVAGMGVGVGMGMGMGAGWGPLPGSGGKGGAGAEGGASPSSAPLSRRTSMEALEELKAYSDMRQALLRQRGEGGARAPRGGDRRESREQWQPETHS